MTVSEWQNWVAAFDEARGWQEVAPEHTALHLMEEFGEIARELLRRAAYKEGEVRLAEEMADFLLLFFKLANQTGVDLEPALLKKAKELEKRFPISESRQAMERYRSRHAD